MPEKYCNVGNTPSKLLAGADWLPAPVTWAFATKLVPVTVPLGSLTVMLGVALAMANVVLAAALP
jgi:hypothetical protein